MQFTVSRSSLVGYLTKAKPHLGKAGLLSNIRALLNSNTLEILAQDGYTALEAEIAVENPKGHGSFLFPIAVLDYLKTLSDLQVTVNLELPENAETPGKMTLPGATFVILSSFDYPATPERNWVELATLDGLGLNLALTNAPNFASKTDITASVKLAVDKDSVFTYATDKSFAYRNKGPAPHKLDKPIDILIGSAYFAKLQDVVSESAKFYFSDNLYKVKSGSFAMTFGAGDVTKYPPTIASMFEDEVMLSQAVLVDRLALKQIIRTALIFVKSRAQNPVSLTFNEDGSKLKISAIGTSGSYESEIPVVGFVGKTDTESYFAFSAYRLDKVLTQLDSDVVAINYGTYSPALPYVLISESPTDSSLNEVLLSVVVVHDTEDEVIAPVDESDDIAYSEINDLADEDDFDLDDEA